MIYTLGYLHKEAEQIYGRWNGSDKKFIDGNGETRTDEEAQIASELLQKLTEIEELTASLGI